MTEFQGDQKLLEEPSCIILLQALAMIGSFISNDILKHVPSSSKFHDDGQVIRGKEHLLELYNVWMDYA